MPKLRLHYLQRLASGAIAVTMIFVALTCCGCLAAVKDLYPPSPERGCKTIYVVNHGWHTGVIVNWEHMAVSLWPATDNIPRGKYIEFGWGDEQFYQADEITAGMRVKAVFLPTAAVMHVVGLPDHPRVYYKGAETLAIDVSSRGLENLVRFLRGSYARDMEGSLTILGPGLQENSYFYKAEGTYSAFNTCNNWVARALRKTGFPVTPIYALTAGNIVYQIKRAPRLEGRCE
jgi:uncharacterized protein (TIGR02117 family)